MYISCITSTVVTQLDKKTLTGSSAAITTHKLIRHEEKKYSKVPTINCRNHVVLDVGLSITLYATCSIWIANSAPSHPLTVHADSETSRDGTLGDEISPLPPCVRKMVHITYTIYGLVVWYMVVLSCATLATYRLSLWRRSLALYGLIMRILMQSENGTHNIHNSRSDFHRSNWYT